MDKKEEGAKKFVDDFVELLIQISDEEGIEIINYAELRKELTKIFLEAWEEKEKCQNSARNVTDKE
jgi:hypothetical protein